MRSACKVCYADLAIRGNNDFLWLGEAKIANGNQSLLNGFDQLSTRYSVATPGRDRGEIIIYDKRKNSKSRFELWREHLAAERPVKLISDSIATKLEFETQNECPTSGLMFTIRHRIVPMNFEPKK